MTLENLLIASLCELRGETFTAATVTERHPDLIERVWVATFDGVVMDSVEGRTHWERAGGNRYGKN